MINFPDAPILDQSLLVGGISWRWDGGKWVVGDSRAGSTNVIAPASGATVTLTEVRPYYINNPTTLASLVIRLPQIAASGDLMEVSFLSPVTSLAVQDWLGAAITGSPTSAYGPGAGLVFRYVDQTDPLGVLEVMYDIRIDEPGAGEWVMNRLGGIFTPKLDHSFSSHDGDRILGGFVLTWFLGGSLTVHMASQDKRWCSRDLLWLVFHYSFEQLGVHKMLTPLSSDQHEIIAMDMRAGWGLEATIRDAYAPGQHMLILSMTKDTCPWLRYKPRHWVSLNKEAA